MHLKKVLSLRFPLNSLFVHIKKLRDQQNHKLRELSKIASSISSLSFISEFVHLQALCLEINQLDRVLEKRTFLERYLQDIKRHPDKVTEKFSDLLSYIADDLHIQCVELFATCAKDLDHHFAFSSLDLSSKDRQLYFKEVIQFYNHLKSEHKLNLPLAPLNLYYSDPLKGQGGTSLGLTYQYRLGNNLEKSSIECCSRYLDSDLDKLSIRQLKIILNTLEHVNKLPSGLQRSNYQDLYSTAKLFKEDDPVQFDRFRGHLLGLGMVDQLNDEACKIFNQLSLKLKSLYKQKNSKTKASSSQVAASDVPKVSLFERLAIVTKSKEMNSLGEYLHLLQSDLYSLTEKIECDLLDKILKLLDKSLLFPQDLQILFDFVKEDNHSLNRVLNVVFPILKSVDLDSEMYDLLVDLKKYIDFQQCQLSKKNLKLLNQMLQDFNASVSSYDVSSFKVAQVEEEESIMETAGKSLDKVSAVADDKQDYNAVKLTQLESSVVVFNSKKSNKSHKKNKASKLHKSKKTESPNQSLPVLSIQVTQAYPDSSCDIIIANQDMMIQGKLDLNQLRIPENLRLCFLDVLKCMSIQKARWASSEDEIEFNPYQESHQLTFYKKLGDTRVKFFSVDYFDLEMYPLQIFSSFDSMKKTLPSIPKGMWFFNENFYYTGAVTEHADGFVPTKVINGYILETGIIGSPEEGKVRVLDYKLGKLQSTYIGGWVDGQKQGKGVLEFSESEQMSYNSVTVTKVKKYEALWQDDIVLKYLSNVYSNGYIYSGEFNDLGRPHGQGAMYYPNGNLQYEGVFHEGKIMNA